MTKKVSVIILNWNGSLLLKKYLPSVVGFSSEEFAEIVVADNGSTDESLEILEKDFPSVKVIRLDQNYGFSKGYNLAIDQVSTPYVILLNDDVRVSEHWLEPMLEYMENNPNVGALQPKLLSDRDSSMFEYAGGAGGYLDKFGYPFCRGRIFDTIEKDAGQYDDIKKIMWATGACMMIRTDLYKKSGGLDPYFFAHMEEIDLCWRIRNLGYDIVYLPSSVVFHYGGGSLAVGNPQKTKLNFRNSLLMLYKNLQKEERTRKIFIRKLLDFVAAINFLIHFQFAQIKAIWQAHREYDKMVKEIYLRAGNQKVPTKISTRQSFPEEEFSILWKYYLLGKKKYSEL